MENKTITTTPSTEVKAPATTTTAATPATTTSVTVTTTPTATTSATATATPTATTSATATATPAATTSATITLPDNYLAGGYFHGEGKGRYLDPALVDQAAMIGKALSASKTPPAALNRMVRTLKTAARLPYPAKQGALKKLVPQVLDLENRKKAPALLREVVERNQAAVKDEADYKACLSHIQDISIFLASEQD